MIMIIALWSFILGYTFSTLGLDKIQGGKATFAEVFIPGYLQRKRA